MESLKIAKPESHICKNNGVEKKPCNETPRINDLWSSRLLK